MYRRRLFIISITIFLVLCSCARGMFDGIRQPRAEHGVIDLRSWDFGSNGMVNLSGTWEFYWGVFLEPGKTGSPKSPQPEYATVPGVWNVAQHGMRKYPEYGFATYRLTIRLGRFRGPMALKMEEMTTAYSLWVDGELLATSGTIGTSMALMTPEFLPKSAFFTPRGDSIELVFHVSNYWNNKGGLWKNTYLGSRAGILAFEEGKLGFDFFVAGALLIMAIYHLILFFLERKNWAALYFGAFCFLMALRAVMNDERIIYHFVPYFSWNIAQRIELLTTYIGVSVFAAFFRSLYPGEVGDIPARIFQIAGIVWAAVTLFVPPTLISFTFDVFQYVLYSICAFSVYALVRAIARRRYGAILFAIGVAILSSAIVNDILYSQFVINTTFVTPFGLVIGIFFVEVALNVKFVRTEQAFQSEFEKSRAILSATPDSMIQLLENGVISDFRIKPDIEPLFALPPAAGLHVSSVFERELAGSIVEAARSVFGSDTPSVIVAKIARPGGAFHCEVRIVESEKGKMLLILRDITAQVEAEEELSSQREQLIHADKLVALGTLTAGVAHEINNPNNAILLASQVNEDAFRRIIPLLDEAIVEKGDAGFGGYTYEELVASLKDSLSRVTRNSRRIKLIVEDLKSFAGKDSGVLDQNLSLNEIVESGVRLLENLIKKEHRKFSASYAKDPPRVLGNGQRLEQVFINILSNACYALSDHGKGVSITTGSDKPAREAFVEVRDEGIGMDDETRRRIFDPFFTTRRGTGGTGLGLPISARIVADHGGRIEIVSEKGKGTTIRIVLPEWRKQ